MMMNRPLGPALSSCAGQKNPKGSRDRAGDWIPCPYLSSLAYQTNLTGDGELILFYSGMHCILQPLSMQPEHTLHLKPVPVLYSAAWEIQLTIELKTRSKIQTAGAGRAVSGSITQQCHPLGGQEVVFLLELLPLSLPPGALALFD